MLIHFGVDTLRPGWKQSTVCIGTFDGVHLGHQKLIRETVHQAEAAEHPSIVVTFDRHPAAIVAPDRCPPAVASLSENLDLMRNLGVAVAVILPFTSELAHTPAQSFFDHILIAKLRAASIVVGHDFGFGYRREGDGHWLSSRIDTTVVPAVQMGNHRVSSSEVRSMILSGDIRGAASLLGRDWALRGIVVAGQKLGRTLGYPTINLVVSSDVVTPRDGIYAATAETAFGTYSAAVSIGNRPTVGGTTRTIEAFLLDYPGQSLYGHSVRLQFQARLRDELKFDSLDSLTEQMAKDILEVRGMTSAKPASL